MTQPSFVPIAEADQVRSARRMKVPTSWTTDRPAEVTVPIRSSGGGKGSPGPDQGFALKLARRFADQLRLEDGESSHDAEIGCALLASRRAAMFGRAPCVHDLTAAFGLWGFLAPAPGELVAFRRAAFASASHSYEIQRAMIDGVPERSLRLSPLEIEKTRQERGWQELVGPVAGMNHDSAVAPPASERAV